jgi:hypothetical protein
MTHEGVVIRNGQRLCRLLRTGTAVFDAVEPVL